MKQVFSVIAVLLALSCNCFAYNRTASIAYAADAWTKKDWDDDPNTPDSYNPSYADYSDSGGDCANFVSQCLIDGGFGLSKFEEYLEFTGFDDRGSIINCDVLADFLTSAARINAVRKTKDELGGQKLEDATTISEGDIIIYGDDNDTYKHSVIVGPGTDTNSGNLGYYAHTEDRQGEYGLNWPLGQLPTATVFHFPTKEETGCDERIFATGLSYSGEDVFIRVRYSDEGTLNIEGFIWENPDPEEGEQDMVIGEPEEILVFQTGCAYLLSGYCIDADKSAPSADRSFSNVWTSTSSLQWAYWVRKAVEYANDNYEKTSENQIKLQDALWCITDRKGVYNEIVKNIGYDLRDISKNVMITEDNIPPATITTLHARTIDNVSYLYWAATGDDETDGTATYYDIKYASFPFTEADFENLANVPYSKYFYPSEAGSADLCPITITGIDETYYLALRVTDECGNWSDMSNIAVWKTGSGGFANGEGIKAYSYPNPAKNCSPTIHIECLQADKIEIKIHTITGEKVYSTTVISPISVNGSIYVYEKSWKVSNIASGVYFCVTEVHRGGAISKKFIKIAVIK